MKLKIHRNPLEGIKVFQGIAFYILWKALLLFTFEWK